MHVTADSAHSGNGPWRGRFFAWAFAAMACAPAEARDVAWPLLPCSQSQIDSASPAPLPNDTASLAEMPFHIGLLPTGVTFIAALDADNRPRLRCFIADASDWRLIARGSVAAAGLALSTPLRPNTAEPDPLYVIAIATNFGISWVDAPPPQPLLPWCPESAGGINRSLPDAPRPVWRVPPVYPAQAERAGIEGKVEIVLETFSSGVPVPRCIASSGPEGWFEDAAIKALEQWRFAPTPDTRPRRYRVHVNFRLE